MKVITKDVRETVSILDELVKKYKEKHLENKRDWRTYEQRTVERLKVAFRELKPLVNEAVSSINFVYGETRGADHILSVEQRVIALLIKHLIGKSNRNMASMFVIFSLLNNIDVSYKTVERFYDDPEVIHVLHNLHALMLNKKGIKETDSSGDGSGYSLTIKKNYASEAQKLKDKIKESENQKEYKKKVFVYSFNLIDLKTKMYLCCGMSFKSEKEAFINAIEMLKKIGIKLKSLRLDRYYQQDCIEFLEKELGKITFYIIPKKNSTVKGSWEWKRMLYEFVNNTQQYLEKYFKRNNSESGFAEDKKRTGWKLGQKREDRLETANFCTLLWHNLSWLG